jgi:hypothetical protein
LAVFERETKRDDNPWSASLFPATLNIWKIRKDEIRQTVADRRTKIEVQ